MFRLTVPPATSTAAAARSASRCLPRWVSPWVLSAVIFNAIIIVMLIPLALRGVRYTPSAASKLLSRNLYVYGVGGIIAPFVGIKLIDLVIQFIPGMS
jgi:high-affinity K+ transport system ATPase subunit B